jgi:hypothetical protein
MFIATMILIFIFSMIIPDIILLLFTCLKVGNHTSCIFI